MLSRIADSLYWMARYLERVDNTARLLEINLLHLLEVDDAVGPAAHWRPLLGISDSLERYATTYPDGEITAERVIRFMTQERTNPNAIRASLRQARDNARVVRDRLSREMWESLNDVWLRAQPVLDGLAEPDALVQFYRTIRSEVARFHGVTASTMPRGEDHGFYVLGSAIERADMTARILDVKYHLLLPELSLVGSALDYYQWAALLRSLSGFEAYRRRYHGGFSPATVAEFVILDPCFPRSLRFAVDRMAHALTETDDRPVPSATRQCVAALQASLRRPPMGEIFAAGLHEFLREFIDAIRVVDATLHDELYSLTLEMPCAT